MEQAISFACSARSSTMPRSNDCSAAMSFVVQQKRDLLKWHFIKRLLSMFPRLCWCRLLPSVVSWGDGMGRFALGEQYSARSVH